MKKTKTTSKKSTSKIPVAGELTVFHKTNCQTSCGVMSYLKKKKIKVDTRLYLESPPTEKELENVLIKLDLKPHDLIRTKEKYYQEKLKGLKLNDHEWLKIMVENPILIERPILIRGNKAIIGRPMERVVEFVKEMRK